MKRTYLLVFILLVAAILRFYQLGSMPPSLTWDEAAWGYNAYSLGIDGKDEFGRVLPYTYLESFGDYKPPVYAYLDILPVKVFGLNEFATRFPSAFFGTLTVLLTYFLVKGLFETSIIKSNSTKHYFEDLALISALILAISPWHIMLSRAAFEANVATFFLVSGVTSALYWIRKKQLFFLILSMLSFVLSLYTFNTSRVVAPLLITLLVISFWRVLWQRKKDIIIAGIIGIILVSSLIPFIFSPQAKIRYNEVNIFSDISVIKTANQEIINDGNTSWSKIIHNRRWLFTIDYLSHYFDNFSSSFLFIKGDHNPKFSTQDVGELYLMSLPFLLIGGFLLFKKKEGYWWIVPAWLLLGIIPAATARETPHALRIEATLPTFQLLVAYGLLNTFLFLKQHLNKIQWKSIGIIVGLLYLVNISYFLHGYYQHYAWRYSGEWQYGYKESIAYAQIQQEKYDNIIVTPVLGRPYVYYLFYLHMLPAEFRKEAKVQRDVFVVLLQLIRLGNIFLVIHQL